MSRYKATGKVASLGEVYAKLDSTFRNYIDRKIDKKRNGYCLLRLLRLTSKTHTPTTLLSALLKTYKKDEHYFVINGHSFNITLEDVLYLTGLPIDGNAVIAQHSRDSGAFKRVFKKYRNLRDKKKNVTLKTLKAIVLFEKHSNKERRIALLLMVIDCFIAPNCDTNIIPPYLVQFVKKLKNVNSYAWGAALLAKLYCAIENDKETVDANCWPLLAFFCIRIPKLCEALDFDINLENCEAPLLNECMKAMQKFSVNKKGKFEAKISSVLDNLKEEEIKWHPYTDYMLADDLTRHNLPFVTSHAPMLCMSFAAYHRPLSHLKQFRGLEEYVGKSVTWTPEPIKLKQNKGDSDINFEDAYKKELQLWKDRKPVEEFIRKVLKPPSNNHHTSPSCFNST